MKSLGSAPLAALGLATTLISATLWVFNFLGIGTQTEVATADGRGDREAARDAFGSALALAFLLGLALAALGWPLASEASRLMGATGGMVEDASVYLRIRLLGAPATLVMMAGFGALRGLQDMRTPLRVAIAINLLNIALDALLIFGAGPIPALGIAGAAWASTAAQWVGAAWAAAAARARLGLPERVRPRDMLGLFVVGRDLFLRTGLLLAFLTLGTRAATQAGADTGAAHHAIRTVWTFVAFLLDAYAIAAQSLVGFFLGAGRLAAARRAAAITCAWGAASGVVLAGLLWLGQEPIAQALVPASAHTLFASAWWIAAAAQPLNALAFVTDGVLWGAGDYRYMRNGMLLASLTCGAALLALDTGAEGLIVRLNAVIVAWIVIRAGVGFARIWPGFGASPLRAEAVRAGR